MAGNAVKDRSTTSSFVGCKPLTAPPTTKSRGRPLLLAAHGGQVVDVLAARGRPRPTTRILTAPRAAATLALPSLTVGAHGSRST